MDHLSERYPQLGNGYREEHASTAAMRRNAQDVVAQFNLVKLELRKDKTLDPEMLDPLAAQLTNAIWSKPKPYSY